jgi:hypothetical protein
MTTEPTETRSGARWPPVLLPLAPLLYLASVGPVAWIIDTIGLRRDSIPGRMISIVYWPVEFLINEVPLFADVLMWYVGVFLP